MKKKERIRTIFYCLLITAFFVGYIIGNEYSKQLEEPPKTVFEIMQEGYDRVGK